MSERPLKFKDMALWKTVAYVDGIEAAGRRPPTPPSPAHETWKRHLPVAPMMFGGPGPETREAYEERQRRRHLDALCKKHGIGQPRDLWRRV